MFIPNPLTKYRAVVLIAVLALLTTMLQSTSALAASTDVYLDKTAVFNDETGDGLAQVGETITYTFTVGNTSTSQLTNVTITDPLMPITGGQSTLNPAFTAESSYVGEDADTSDGLTYTFGPGTTLPEVGQEVTLCATALYQDDPVTNTVVCGDGTGFEEGGTVVSISGNDVTLDAGGAGGRLPTGPSDFLFGPSDAEVVTFEEVYVLTQADVDAGQVSNQATVTADGGISDLSDDPADATSTDDPTVVSFTGGESLKLEKTGTFNDTDGDGFAQVGETISYQFSVANTAPSGDLTNVDVTDPLITVNGGPTVLDGRFTAESIEPGVSPEFDGWLPGPSGTQRLAEISFDSPIITNNPAFQMVEVGQTLNVCIDNVWDYDFMVAPPYPIVCQDGGGGGAGQTVLVTVDSISGLTATIDFTGTAIFSPTDISPISVMYEGQAAETDTTTFTGTYTLTQADIDAGFVSNQATATSDETSDALSDDPADGTSLFDPTIVPFPTKKSIEVEKTGTFDDADSSGTADVGETINYTFSIENTGEVTLSNVDLVDDLAGMTLTGTPIGSLAPGAVDTSFTGTYTITAPDIANGAVANQATVTAEDASANTISDLSDDPTNGDDVDTEADGEPDDATVVTLPSNGSVELTKIGVFNDTNGDGFAQIGETIDYTLIANNTGSVTLTDVAVTDPLIAAITPATATLTAGAPSSSGSHAYVDDSTLLWGSGSLPVVGQYFEGCLSDGILDHAFSPAECSNGPGNIWGASVTSVSGSNVTFASSPFGGHSGISIWAESFGITGGSQVYNGTYTLTAADIVAGEVINQATITSTEGAADNSDDPSNFTDNDTNGDSEPDDETITAFNSAAKVRLYKIATHNDTNQDGFAQAGETIRYNFTIYNLGIEDLTNVTVTDPNAAIAGGSITVAAGGLDSTTIIGTYTLTQADIELGYVENSASVDADSVSVGTLTDVSDAGDDVGETPDALGATDGDPTNDPTIITLVTKDEITLEKVGTFNDGNGNGAANPGESIDYVFTITNSGSTTLNNITVTDPLSGLVLSGSAIATLAPGDSDNTSYSGTYTIAQSDIDTGSVTNQATVSSEDADLNVITDLSDDPADATGDDDETVVDVPVVLEAELDKSGTFNDENGDGLAQIGETVTYDFTLRNAGNADLTNISVSDPKLPITGAPTTLKPVIIDNSSSFGSDNTSGSGFRMNFNPADPAAAGLGVGDEVSWIWTWFDFFTFGSDSDTFVGTVTAITNINASSAIVDLDLVSGSWCTNPNMCTGQWTSSSDGEESWSETYTLTAADIAAQEVQNQATATADGGVSDLSDDPADATSEDDITIVPLTIASQVELEKVGTFQDENGDGFAQVGETIDYAFTVTNPGTIDTDNIVVTDPLMTVNGGTIAKLTPSASDSSTLTGTYTLTLADLVAGQVSNQATATGDNGAEDLSDDPNEAADVDANGDGEPDDPTIVLTPPEVTLAVEKVGTFQDENGDGFAQVGETIAYSFKITNSGGAGILNTVVSDPMPGVVVTGSIPALSAGSSDSSSITAVYTLAAADIAAKQVTNQAGASSDEGAFGVSDDPDDATSDSDPTVVTLPDTAGIQLTKSISSFFDADSDGELEEGETINYSFTAKNTGIDELTNVTVTDPKITVTGGPITLDGVVGPAHFDATLISGTVIQTTDTLLPLAGQDITVCGNGTYDSVADSCSDGGTPVVRTVTFKQDLGGGTFRLFLSGSPGALVSPDFYFGASTPETDTSSFFGTYTVTAADVLAGFVENSATISADTPDGETITDVSDAGDETTETEDGLGATNGDPTDDPTVIELTITPKIELEKVASLVDTNANGVGDEGETINYDFTITNTGVVAYSNITVSDPLTGISLAGTPVFNFLNPGDVDTTVSGAYVITAADVTAGKVTNQATAEVVTAYGTITDLSDDPSNAADVDAEADGDPDDETVFYLVPQSVEIEKTATFVDANSNGFADVGETINYAFSIENTGVATLTNVTVTDPNATVVGSIASLATGVTDGSSITASHVLTQADLDAGEVSNQATVLSDEGATDLSDDPGESADVDANADGEPDDPTVVELTTDSKLEVEKVGTFNDTDSDGFAQVGETISYTFSIENTGTTALTNVALTDSLAGNVVSGAPIATLALGATDAGTFTAVYTLTQADLDAGEVTNQATVTADGGVTDLSDDPGNGDDVDANADGEPDDPTIVDLTVKNSVELEKVGVHNDANSDGFADVGETITYTFSVENTGEGALTNLKLTDPLSGLVISGSNIATLAVGATDTSNFTATYTLASADLTAGEVTNQATISAAQGVSDLSDDPGEGADVDTEADGEPDDETVVSYAVGAQVELIKTGVFNDLNSDGFADLGETITYTFTVKNTGGSDVTNVTITDPLITVAGTLAALASGASDSTTFTGTYTLTAPDLVAGEVSNQATVNTTEGASDLSDDPGDATSDDDFTVIAVPSESKVGLEKSGVLDDANGNGFADVGETINYTFNVENTGDNTITNITVTDAKATVAGGSIASLATGASDNSTITGTYVLTQADLDAREVVNQATVTTAESVSDTSDDPTDGTDDDANGDGEPDDETVTTLTVDSSISLVKAATFNDEDGDGFAQVGETIGYTFAIENTGDAALTDVTVTDSVGGVTVSGSPIASMAPGATDTSTFTASYTLTQADIDAGEFVNQATVDTDEGTSDDSGATNNDDVQTTTTLTTDDEVTLVKTGTHDDADGDGFAQAGETIDYTFTIENTGDVTLNSVELDDVVGGITVSGSAIASLAPGATDTATFTASYTLLQADIDAGEFFNTASIDSDEGTSASSDETVTLTVDEGITLVKAGTFADENGDGFAQAGETIDYTFSIENTGGITLTSVELDDVVGGVTVSGSAIPTLAPGVTDSSTYTASYTITGADITAGEFANQASVDNDEGVSDLSGTAADNDDETVVSLAQPADLAVTAVTSPTLEPDEKGVFTVTIENNGPGASGSFDVTYTLPTPLLSFDTTHANPDGCSITGAVVTCTVAGPLAVGADLTLTIPVHLNEDITGAGTVVATPVTIVNQSVLDPDDENDSDVMGIIVDLTGDSDGDGIPDIDEVGDLDDPEDTDGDGTPDYLDDDDDGDGIPTTDELGDPNDPTDSDEDGIPDYKDDDDDGDGVPTEDELGDPNDPEDTDEDGTPDYLDDDDDGDGIPTTDELGDPNDPTDSDEDGIPDYTDDDDDGDGVPTSEEVGDPNDPTDTDEDGEPDYLDDDDDGNGIPTVDELGDPEDPTDTDEDGVPDYLDDDDDGDGVPDVDEIGDPNDPTDSDEDGIPDYIDDDDDGDGVPTVDELGDPNDPDDTDGDGTPDYIDDDDDGDGVPTEDELGDPEDPTDTDEDGIPDYVDDDDDDNGVPSIDEVGDPNDPTDTDEDGEPDYLDDDDNGNGIPDIDEIGDPNDPTDSDEDGIPDYQDDDGDNDGIPDVDEIGDPNDPTDSDEDGIPDYLDDDDDGDGIPSIDEIGDPNDPTDSDEDGIPDYIDDDDDGDGIPSIDEVGDPDDPTDSDEDGIPDYVDDDDDGDGVPTDEEVGGDPGEPDDTDGDGTPDYIDDDDDGDGVPTVDELGDPEDPTDTDEDGIPDYVDDDDDDNGVPTEDELGDPEDPTDSDDDGEPDYLDDDDDGNGIPDEDEVGDPNDPTDSDEDGIPDYQDDDDDNDGVPDVDEIGDPNDPTDSDEDGIPDYLDDDDDGDGIPTVDELGDPEDPTDTDEDGIPDYVDDDDDGDGVPTDEEVGGDPGEPDDTDGDGTPDYIDDDDDGDGVPTVDELGDPEDPTDTDEDGTPDYVDDDDDDNGVPTEDELGDPEDPTDSDDDGEPDYLDDDDDGNGIPDEDEVGDPNDPTDSDEDGIPDYQDDDDDNDGVPDVDEIGDPNDPTDSDEDGIPDYLDDDDDGDGVPTVDELGDPNDPTDSDEDGIPDYVDDDDDGDGIPTEDEVGDPNDPTDSDEDGIPDYVDDDDDGDGVPTEDEVGGDPDEPEDTDGDGTPDYIDDDDDGNGVPTEDELGDPEDPTDSDEDGEPDYLDDDDDGNGIPDDDEVGDPEDPTDTDEDGIPDYQDDDNDGDGVPDDDELGDPDDPTDTDGDGIPDVDDDDDDDNGIPTVDELGDPEDPTDTDEDGEPDYLDDDDDGNGIPDVDEMGDPNDPTDSDDDGIPDHQDDDDDGNGIPDVDEIGDPNDPTDSDEDGIPDFQDDDDDGDGIPDTDELGDPSDPNDSDDDGIPDHQDDDSDGDGIPDENEGGDDTDGDGDPDFQDDDSDGDGIPDSVEAGDDPANPDDSDNDGIPNYLDDDSDNDGVPDSVEAADGFDKDTDGDGIPDYLDAAGVTVTGQVFFDTNRDGLINGNTEVDISNVGLALMEPGPDGEFGSSDDINIQRVKTASPYVFTDVPDGVFEIVIDVNSLPTGIYGTLDADKGIKNVIRLEVAGEDLIAQNFGVSYAAIGGVVTDDNGDPISNTEITVTDADGNTFTVTTDDEGNYFVEGSAESPLTLGTATISTIVDGKTVTQTVDVADGTLVIRNLGSTSDPDTTDTSSGTDGSGTDSTKTPGTLAFTGQSLKLYILAGFVLVAAGVFAARRSRRESETA